MKNLERFHLVCQANPVTRNIVRGGVEHDNVRGGIKYYHDLLLSELCAFALRPDR
jgi:hypothetical protein